MRYFRATWKAALFTVSIFMLLLAGVWAAHVSILRSAASWWVVSDQITAPADAVVVLGGGFEIRPRAAADIFNRGYARRVLVVNPEIDRQRWWLLAHERTFLLLQKLGVPAASLVDLGGDAKNTYEEARLVLDWARASGAHKIVVPTDLFHTRRTRWTFAKVLSDVNVAVEVEPINPKDYSQNDWWLHKDGLTAFLSEIPKYLMYRIRY